MDVQKQYDVVDEKLKTASEDVNRVFQNAQSVSLILGMLSTVEARISHFEKILRAVDFLQGLHQEYTKILTEAGVLKEKVSEAVSSL